MLPIDKLDALAARHDELEEQLCRPEIATDAKRFTQLNRERVELGEVVRTYRRFREVDRQITENRAMLEDPELGDLAKAELSTLEVERDALFASIGVLLLPKDP